MATNYCPRPEPADEDLPRNATRPNDDDYPFTDDVWRIWDTAMLLKDSTTSDKILPHHLELALIYPGISDINELYLSKYQKMPALDISLIWRAMEKAGYPQATLVQIVKTLQKKCQEEPSSIGSSATGDNESLSQEVLAVRNMSLELMRKMGDMYIAEHHMLLAAIKLQHFLLLEESSENEVVSAILRLRRKQVTTNLSMTFPVLRQFSTDLTKLAMEDALGPVIGREEELRRLIVILSRRKNNNAILIGDAGVGKTAIAHALAIRMARQDRLPANLNARIFSLDMGSLLSSTSCHGKMELRVKAIMKEIADSNDEGSPIILHIDDIHLIMTGRVTGGTGGMDAANLMKPLLASGKLRCFGATTMSDYTRYLESDTALIRRFTLIPVCEPSVQQTVSILRAMKRSLEEHHLISISDSALIEASELANRYMASRRLPDSAIDIVDEACSALNLRKETKPLVIIEQESRISSLQLAKSSLEMEFQHSSGSTDARMALAEVHRQLATVKEDYERESHRYNKELQARSRREKTIRQLEETVRKRERYKQHARLKDVRASETEIAAIMMRLQHEPSLVVSEPEEVTPEVIVSIVSQQTRIPLQSDSSAKEHSDLSSDLNKEVVNQQEAVSALCEAVNLIRVGLHDRQRPTAALLFAGPSGCGKTFVVEQLAKLLFKANNRLLRINGSEYSNPLSIERLIGTPSCSQHSQPGVLTECVKRKPFSVILIDHIELTCIEFRHKIQAVIDKGFLVDADGGPVDFRNCILILTTTFTPPTGTVTPITQEGKKDILKGQQEFEFSDELLDRLDRIILFNALTQSDIQRILEKRLEQIKARVEARGVYFNVQHDALKYLAAEAHSEQSGAREIDRVVKREVIDRFPDLNNRKRDITLSLILDTREKRLNMVQRS